MDPSANTHNQEGGKASRPDGNSQIMEIGVVVMEGGDLGEEASIEIRVGKIAIPQKPTISDPGDPNSPKTTQRSTPSEPLEAKIGVDKNKGQMDVSHRRRQ